MSWQEGAAGELEDINAQLEELEKREINLCKIQDGTSEVEQKVDDLLHNAVCDFLKRSAQFIRHAYTKKIGSCNHPTAFEDVPVAGDLNIISGRINDHYVKEVRLSLVTTRKSIADLKKRRMPLEKAVNWLDKYQKLVEKSKKASSRQSTTQIKTTSDPQDNGPSSLPASSSFAKIAKGSACKVKDEVKQEQVADKCKETVLAAMDKDTQKACSKANPISEGHAISASPPAHARNAKTVQQASALPAAFHARTNSRTCPKPLAPVNLSGRSKSKVETRSSLKRRASVDWTEKTTASSKILKLRAASMP